MAKARDCDRSLRAYSLILCTAPDLCKLNACDANADCTTGGSLNLTIICTCRAPFTGDGFSCAGTCVHIYMKKI